MHEGIDVMKFQSMIKTGLILGVSMSLFGCGTCHQQYHPKKPVDECFSAIEKDSNISRTAQVSPETKVISSTYHFQFDNAKLSEDSLNELDRYAAYLNENPDARIRIEGHADQRGKASYNVALGKRRAEAVSKYLNEQGITQDRIEVYSYGAENPIDLADNDQAYAKNRRAEIFFEMPSAHA